MKRRDLSNATRLRPQKLSARDTPHATIEPNTTCNIRCKFCYAIEHPKVKPLAEVEAEIDLALRKRNLDAISLLGGEPTLHPALPDIVRYVKSKGLVCQVLTNGVRFLHEQRLDLLDELVAAGVDRFLVHIDSGQRHVHADLDQARHRLFALLDEREVYFGHSLTLYAGEEAQLPELMRRYAKYRFFDGALVTLAMDFAHAFVAEDERCEEPAMAEVAAGIERDLGIEPAAYIPSNLDDDEICWLMYFYWINTATGETFGLSPELNRAMKLLYRTMEGHEFFADTLEPDMKGVLAAASGAAETLLHPRRARDFARLLAHSKRTRTLRFHYIVVQQAPRMNAAHQKVQLCWQCPDAVVRRGKLTPVCIAGRVNPLDGGPPRAPREVVETVFRHLQEEPPG
jgi:hypothetical protein